MGNAKSKHLPTTGVHESPTATTIDSAQQGPVHDATSEAFGWDARVRSLLHNEEEDDDAIAESYQPLSSDLGLSEHVPGGQRGNSAKKFKNWNRGQLCARTVGQEWTELPATLFIPSCRHAAASLKSLRLCCHSTLTRLPNDFIGGIGWASRLTTLDLSNNGLVTLPFCLASLSNLQELTLSRNKLTRLPLFLANIPNMRTLSLDSNALERIDAALLLAWCSSLKILDLSYNERLTSLPIELLKCRNLSILRITGNVSLFTPDELAPLAEELKELSSLSRARSLSMKEMAMRSLFSSHETSTLAALPSSLKVDLVAGLRVCSHCGQYYSLAFEQLWFKWIDWMGVRLEGLPFGSESGIRLAYQLCSLHWRSEAERIVQLFQSSPHAGRRHPHRAHTHAKTRGSMLHASPSTTKRGASSKSLLPDIDSLFLRKSHHATSGESERTLLELLLQRDEGFKECDSL